ncbi:MAG TPA: hypothetical protein VFQ53_08515 [Kofleriaceae bacterium]|nr:hypothetical protein [Kofleriaceae bacterium]
MPNTRVSPENERECLVVERERHEARADEDRGARPQRPLDDQLVAVLVGEDLRDVAVRVQPRREHAVRQQPAEQQRPAGAKAHQRAGTDQHDLGLEIDRPAHQLVAADVERQRDVIRQQLEDADECLDQAAHGEPDAERRELAAAAFAPGVVQRADRGCGRGAGREREALLVDQLTLDRDRDEHAHRRDHGEPHHHLPDRGRRLGAARQQERRLQAVPQLGDQERWRQHHQQRAVRCHVAARGHVPGARCDGRQCVVLERAERALDEADALQPAEQREREDARGQRDAKAPPGLEEDVEVRQAHDRADPDPREHGAHREVRLVGLIDLAEPGFFRIDRGRVGGIDLQS